MCAINLSGCGSWTEVNHNVQCATPPQLQHNFAVIKFEQTETIGQLKIVLPRISERFGVITCYRVFVIKLPLGSTLSDFPTNPSELNVTSYAQVHYHQVFQPQAYIADEINSDNFNNEVIIGDRNYSNCLRSAKVNMGSNGEAERLSNTSGLIDDGPLAELSNYTGFVEIHVLGSNGVILRKQSTYLSPMQTSSSPLLLMPTSTNAVSPLLSSIGNPSTTILLCLISGIALILLIVILILWLLIRRSSDSNTGRTINDGTNERLTSAQQSKHIHRNGLITNGYLPSMRTNAMANQLISVMPIHVVNLAQVYRERIAQNNHLFELEFNSLPNSFDDRSTLANDVEENMAKNRFPSVKCYDQTRVRLSLTDGKPNSDFINANFVSYGDKLYICTQGPLESTIKDFWRMIYEYESSVIVMLTGCEEQGKPKCSQYWFDDSVKSIDDTFLVSVKSVRIHSDYIIRRFQLSTSDQKYNRDILQFHYTMWRDFSATELPSRILRFIKHVNENYCADKGPLVVHCCAGLGRSASYIAIDSLLPEIISGFVNIYECVLNLRYQRNHSIQTLNQYIFIYRALLEFAHFGDTEVDIDHFGDYYQQILEQQIDSIDNVNLLNTQFDVSSSHSFLSLPFFSQPLPI
jgi:protein-tyrosine phosphatase